MLCRSDSISVDPKFLTDDVTVALLYLPDMCLPGAFYTGTAVIHKRDDAGDLAVTSPYMVRKLRKGTAHHGHIIDEDVPPAGLNRAFEGRAAEQAIERLGTGVESAGGLDDARVRIATGLHCQIAGQDLRDGVPSGCFLGMRRHEHRTGAECLSGSGNGIVTDQRRHHANGSGHVSGFRSSIVGICLHAIEIGGREHRDVLRQPEPTRLRRRYRCLYLGGGLSRSRRRLLFRLQLGDDGGVAGLRLVEQRLVLPWPDLLLQSRDGLLDLVAPFPHQCGLFGETLDRVHDPPSGAERIGIGDVGDMDVMIGRAGKYHVERVGVGVIEPEAKATVAAKIGLLGPRVEHLAGLRQDCGASVLHLVDGLATKVDAEFLAYDIAGRGGVFLGPSQPAVDAVTLLAHPADAVPDTMLLAVVLAPLRGKPARLLAEVHFLKDQGIAGRSGLHLGCIGRFAGDVLDFPKLGAALADLLDKPCLAFDRLPLPGVQRVLGGIAQDLDLEPVGILGIEFVALTDTTAVALFEIRRPPRCIEMVKGNKPVLHVGAGAHLRSRSEQETDLAGSHLAEQLLLLEIGIGVVDECDFAGRHAAVDQLLPQIVVDRERGVQGEELVG